MPTATSQTPMMLALAEARDAATRGEVPVGAVVTQGGACWPAPGTARAN